MTSDTINDAMTMRTGGGPALGRIDQYELVRELGGGGFGAVYLAKDTVSGIEVAVKGLPPLVRNNREELENVRRNFALVSRLTHENIAKALVLHPAREVCYFDKRAEELLRVASGDTLMVMDFAPGSTLSKWRKQFDGGIVPLEKAAGLLEQIASALDYAHERKIVHRDIKPANVMVETSIDGVLTARVLDFGLAAEIRSSMSRVSMQITDTSGTRPYMAPEQWAGRRQGPATDQYALAVLACELLVGEVPFKSAFDTGDPMVMMNAVASHEPEFPDGVSSVVARALKKALAKDPGDRFATCRDFVAALCGRRVKWRRGGGGRHVPAKALLAVSLAALAAAGGWWMWRTLEERRRVEAAALKDAAVELQERARIAHEDADRRRFAEVPELARMHREFERFYRSGMKSFGDGDFASATNFFCKVGVCMREMFAEKRKIDEAEAKRNAERDRRLRLAEVDRKVSLGYQRRKGADGEDEAVWVEGVPHKDNAALKAGLAAETWVAVAPGYKWDGGSGAVWSAGVKHPSAAHWISGKRVGEWTAEPGYEPLSKDSGGLSALVWKPGLAYGDFKSSEEEGTWLRKVKCGGCGGERTTTKTDICASCGGARRRAVSHDCSSCGGSGSVSSRSQCGSCGGSGSKMSVCSGCGGSGRLRCGGCNGTGMVANVGGMIASGIVSAFSKTRSYAPHAPSQIPCGRCSGSGVYVCGTCSGGGMKRASCASCRGSGNVSSKRSCAACGGSGKVSATETCSACAGAGTVRQTCDCAECGGTGFSWQPSQRPEDAFAMLGQASRPPATEVKKVEPVERQRPAVQRVGMRETSADVARRPEKPVSPPQSLSKNAQKLVGSWKCRLQSRKDSQYGTNPTSDLMSRLPESGDVCLVCREDGSAVISEDSGRTFGRASGKWKYRHGMLMLDMEADDGISYEIGASVSWRGDGSLELRFDNGEYGALIRKRCNDIPSMNAVVSSYVGDEMEVSISTKPPNFQAVRARLSPYVFWKTDN